MNKVKLVIKNNWYYFLNPVDSFQKKLSQRDSIYIVKMLSFQLSLAIFYMFYSYSFKSSEATLDSSQLIYNSFFGFLILLPLALMLFTMPFHWSANSIGGNGKFLTHLKLNVSAFFNFIKSFLLISLATSIVFIFFPAKEVYEASFILLLIVLLFYFSVATKVTHNFTWVRTILSIMLVFLFMFMVYLSSFALKGF